MVQNLITLLAVRPVTLILVVMDIDLYALVHSIIRVWLERKGMDYCVQ